METAEYMEWMNGWISVEDVLRSLNALLNPERENPWDENLPAVRDWNNRITGR